MMSSRSAPMRKYAFALTLTKLRYLLMRYSAANSSPLLAQSTNCSSTISWYTGTTGLRATTTPLASAPNVRLCQTTRDASRMLASTLFVGAPDHPVVSDDRLPRWALLVAAACKLVILYERITVKSMLRLARRPRRDGVRACRAARGGRGEMPRHFKEQQGRGHGDVERRHPASERNPHHTVAPLPHQAVETATFAAHHHGDRSGLGHLIVSLRSRGIRAHD